MNASEHHPESFVPKHKEQNESILAVLKQLNSQFRQIKETETNIVKKQSILINSQNDFLRSQQQIINKLANIEANMVSKPVMMEQSKLQMECNVAIKRIETTVSRMAGEAPDKDLHKVASMLPMKTIAEVQEVEQRLQNTDFVQEMTAYLVKLKGASEDVSSVIRSLFTDDLLEKYNWEGRWEKLALGKLILFNMILRGVFQQQSAFEFEKSIKKAVDRSHHRMKQKKYLKKSN